MAAVGEIVAGRYRVDRRLAESGLSRVWLAHDLATRTDVVLKQSTLPAGLDPFQRDLIRRWALPEARAVARVVHPHVIRTIDVFPDDDGPWIVMEYLPSRSLQEIVATGGPLPPRRVARIGLALLGALTTANRAGLLHLDVKPGNVLITDDGRVVLTDFAPAVSPPGVAAMARAGIVLGSPKYIAPERLQHRISTSRADLWSLGATLYHAVEGRPPYQRATTTETLRALGASRPDPMRRAGPLAGVLTALLRRDPLSRPTPEELEKRLRRVAEGRIRRRRNRFATTTAVVALAAAIAAGATGTARSGTPPAVVPQPAGSGAPRALPDEFAWWNDRSGYRVAVPESWPADRRPDGSMAFTAPGGRSTLRIDRWPRPPGNPVAALLAEERATVLDDYARLRIEASPEPAGAVWEYTFLAADGVAMRGLSRMIRSGTVTYLLEWHTTRAGWAATLPQLTVALETFGPRSGA
ncbi:serine/threonine-protein kinase [Actinoplanes sp. NBRC 101535]|uniref:serine/threonine-protein kinase n=1 Tax=Actinoplanes sp. NBRC 101535 TaxID=3032196 RepID=UPI00249F997A|nr:serine/threonine-protein kinase [Actinoplanes sp. NBRC 101535]GLY07393.1 hypothetical protein Acsp01_77720 [Actinoplanes sp. NBRC 101535]